MSEDKTKRVKSLNATRLFILNLTAVIFVLSVVLMVFSWTSKKLSELAIPYGLIIITLLLIFLLYKISMILKAIRLVDKNALLLSQGKLNISDIITDRTKGLETLTLAFNEMKRNLLSFIESTKSNVIILSDAVDKVTKSLNMEFKGNEQIAANMNTVAEKAQEQLKVVNDTLDRIHEVSERTGNITTSLANIDVFVGNTVKMAENGSGYLDQYNVQMNVISANLTDTASFIETLNANLKEIDQVNGLIINITEQLKLLSLNSSVEAARAGEAGKGFVVVAHEMNKLSAATRDSIVQINSILANIQNSNSKVSDSIESCVKSFNISKDIFKSVKESFYNINTSANILNEDMKKVYDEAQLINENTKGISEKGILLHDASNEISSVTQDVAAVTEEELAENEEINGQALSLKNMLSGIENLLKRFKTSAAPVEEVSSKHLKIVMLSPLDHPFWHGVRQGALYAQNELKSKNTDVEYFGFEKVDNTFTLTLKEKLEEGCDGIIVPGFIAEIEDCVAAANEKDIPVMAFNCDFKEGVNRLSYFGPDVHSSGILAGEIIVKALDGEGEAAIIRGGLSTSINRIRVNGINEVLHKKKHIKVVAELEAEADNAVVYKNTKEALTKHPDLKCIVVTSGGTIGAAKAIEEFGRVRKVKMVCFDYDDQVIEYIKKGIIYAAVGQDPFGQGHDPIISMYNYIVSGEKPDYITYTRTEVIDIRSIS